MSNIDALAAVPTANCNAVMGAIGASFVIAVPSTSALFFFRVKAVYHNNVIITAVFGFLLLGQFAISFMIPVVARATHIATTQRCINAQDPSWITTPVLLSCINDSLVFIAISLRITSSSITGDTLRERMWGFFRGAGLPYLSKSLLKGGQLYYWSVTDDPNY
jgi:FtsH-binding integral membrane protein